MRNYDLMNRTILVNKAKVIDKPQLISLERGIRVRLLK